MEFLYFMFNVVVAVLVGSFLFRLIERIFDNKQDYFSWTGPDYR